GPPGKPERGKAVKPVNHVFDQLLERIRGGNSPPDSRLPGEHELASMLGVSGAVVRDAMARPHNHVMLYARQGTKPLFN
ncbi:GntR family transcriptional regulator, partial [Rhizobium ruizarguesonis]